MASILYWIIGCGSLGYFEIFQLRKKNKKYESWVFAVFLVFITVYGIANSIGLRLFDPNAYVKWLFGPLGNWMMQPMNK